MASYAVIWRVADGPVCAGQLALVREGFLLDGADRTGERMSEAVGSGEIASVTIGRAREERVDGRVSLVLERADGERLVIASALGVGLIHEIAERLNNPPDARSPA